MFARMIMETGLGNDNIIARWCVIELAQEILSLLDKECTETQPNRNMFTADGVLRVMVDQRVSLGGLNFRHGSAYLTAARFVASNYSQNDKGSEILTAIKDVIELIPLSEMVALQQILER